ncbi:MAG: flagellar export chaperone FliS [Angelakisella sp.]|jgi:flagellar protein FliS|nr:flagellar export chaperone FliS [Angelakisella sp.]MCI9530045.1 flagellar export chaperone FliS [Angelakisella sp.]
MPVNPYQRYQQQSVMTMTPGEMLLKLYDEVITQLTAVRQFNEEKDYEKSNASLKKAQRIIRYLDQTLDPQYEISGSLSALYDYFIRRLVDANLHKDNAPIDEVLPMISDLRDTFAQADKNSRSAGQTPIAVPPVTGG